MLKALTLCAFLAYVHSEEQTQDDNSLTITLVNYQAMYDNECPASSTSSADAPSPADDEGSNSDNDENSYEEKYAGKYEYKYADKYEQEYDGADSPGSVPDNEMGGDGDSNSENQESSTFCNCLAKVKKEGKSYADSQNDFSKCIDEANGNDASHWEKVAKEYEHKFSGKTDGSWNSKVEIATTKASEQDASDDTPVVPAADDADNADNADDADNVDQDDTADQEDIVAEDDNTDQEDDVDNADNTDNTDEDAAALVKLDEDDNRLGNAGIYLTFIGASVLLFICAWFIKDGMKKFKLREYEFVDQSSCYESEADADKNGNPYGGGDDDWDDNYDSNYSRNNNDNGRKKGKFSGWNQYSAV